MLFSVLTKLLHFVMNCESQNGYIDVGDGCWRPNVLVTIMRCWWRFWPFWFWNSVTNIHKSSPILSHQHHCHHRNDSYEQNYDQHRQTISKWSVGEHHLKKIIKNFHFCHFHDDKKIFSEKTFWFHLSPLPKN